MCSPCNPTQSICFDANNITQNGTTCGDIAFHLPPLGREAAPGPASGVCSSGFAASEYPGPGLNTISLEGEPTDSNLIGPASCCPSGIASWGA